MAGLFALLDTIWTDRLEPKLPSTFTTQTLRDLVESEAPEIWSEFVAQYGPGGKGSGNFYSPSNILFNFLRDKAWKAHVVQTGSVPAQPGWGTKIVMGWEKVRTATIPPTEEDIGLAEGKAKLKLHFVRERAPGMRNRLFAARKKSGLFCDICGSTGHGLDAKIRDAIFEAHHAVEPLSAGERKTRVEDLALLCACCHRLIHRLASVQRQWVTVGEAREFLKLNARSGLGTAF
ncbi:hypothetical protein AX761_23185 [Rhizobium sp. 58]|nr:hypothetical protein AX761_23185 [Rhizobium sp. 58]